MNGVVNLGPLAFATDRLLAVVLLLGFVIALDYVQRRDRRAAAISGTLVVAIGILAARLAYVIAYRDAYSEDWWSAFALWQGGFIAWAGLAAAALVLALRLRPAARLLKGLGLLAVFGALWFAGDHWLRPKPVPFPGLSTVTTLQGAPVKPGNGRPMVVNLWATWCPPCRRELPMLAQAAGKSAVPILLINEGESAEKVSRFLRDHAIPAGAVALDRNGELMRALGTSALPTTLFIDASGRIVFRHTGEISQAALTAQIEELEGE